MTLFSWKVPDPLTKLVMDTTHLLFLTTYCILDIMNERIKELMQLAGTDVSGKWMSVDHVEKFAELIIRDCALTIGREEVDTEIDDFDRGFNSGVRISKRKIKERFGVE